MNPVLLSLAFVSGVYVSPRVSVFIALLFALCFLLLISALSLRIDYTARMPAAVLIFTLGIIAGKAASTDEFYTSAGYIGHYVTVTGRICELPQKDDGYCRYILDTRFLKTADESYKLREKLVINSEKEFPYGETVSFSGFIKSFPEKLNENGFDVSQYYRVRHVAGRMNAMSAEVCGKKIRSFTPYSLAAGIRYSISRLIEKYYKGDKAAVLKAVIIGDKTSFSDEFERLLNTTGTKRLFYPAFLHVTLIGMLTASCSVIAGKRKREIILIFLLIIYITFNCDKYSCVKSAMIAAGAILSKRIYGTVYMPDIIAGTVFIIALTNPAALWDTGLIMSVTATIAVTLFYPLLKKRINSKSKLMPAFLIYNICTIALLPLHAHYFGEISPYAIIAQLIFLPIVAGIILTAPLFLILLKLFGSAFVLGWIVNTAVYILMTIPKIIDRLYMNYITLPAFSTRAVLGYFMLCAALFYFLKEKLPKSRICLLIAAGFILNIVVSQLMRVGTVEVNFVNVGQGDGAFIELPFRNSNILIDGGGSGAYSNYDIGENVFVPFLRSKGVSEINSAFVSHYHKDHAQGIVAAINELKVRNLFMPDVMEDCEWRVKLEEAAEKNGTKLRYVSEDTRVIYNSDLVIDIYVPDGISRLSDDENDTSLFMKVSYGEFDCLFTGDMTKIEEKEMLNEGKVSKTEVLKVAHHGSPTSSSEEMIQAADPDVAVISVGENNDYGFPNEDILKRLEGSRIYRTDKNGNIKITAVKDGIKNIKAYKGEYGYGEE